jgi:hypothetical protein
MLGSFFGIGVSAFVKSKFNENYSGTFERIKQTVSQHNSSFQLPLKEKELSIEDTRMHLKEATATLKRRQQDSVALRFRSCMDLLSVYENDTDPGTKKESIRRAKIVQNTIRSEQYREMNKSEHTTSGETHADWRINKYPNSPS